MENDLLNLWHTMDKKYEKYRPRLLKSNELLFNLKDPEEKVKILKDLYAFVKEIAPEFYVEERQEFISLKLLVQILSYCEDALDNEYLIDVKTNREKKGSFSKEEILLNNLVHLNRKYLLDLLTMCGRYYHSFDFYSLEDYWAFLTGDKSILSYEKKITLGFQDRPLKDPTLSFRRH